MAVTERRRRKRERDKYWYDHIRPSLIVRLRMVGVSVDDCKRWTDMKFSEAIKRRGTLHQLTRMLETSYETQHEGPTCDHQTTLRLYTTTNGISESDESRFWNFTSHPLSATVFSRMADFYRAIATPKGTP